MGGDKPESKRVAREAGVPTIEDGSAEALGFPLLVKAAAGGGGRGMRVVRSAGELEGALEAARREAQAAFGDDTVFCERYVERARHVEIQLLADAHGTVLALGERECSIQRRHQKVLEESPSPGLDDELRAALSEAAIGFAKAIGYRGAGTVEFLVAGSEFWFLELNARIQVEHPVTEAVTGRDLVADQIRIAEGCPVVAGRSAPSGHAIEVRLTAEDPRTFLPQAGRIERLRLPGGIRVDAGVEEGDEVGTGYDSLIAKLISHAETRDEAIAQLRAALAETDVRGVTTNLPFLRWLVAHPAFRAGETSTSFLAYYPPLSPPPPRASSSEWRDGFRLNLPARAPAPPPDADDAAHGHAPGGARRDQGADARNRASRPRHTRRRGRGAAAADRDRGDEDGDDARRPVRGNGRRRSRRRGRHGRGRRAARRAGRVTACSTYAAMEPSFESRSPGRTSATRSAPS